jgi:hypothetical protein
MSHQGIKSSLIPLKGENLDQKNYKETFKWVKDYSEAT